MKFMKSRNQYAIKHFPENPSWSANFGKVYSNNFERFDHKECRIGQIVLQKPDLHFVDTLTSCFGEKTCVIS